MNLSAIYKYKFYNKKRKFFIWFGLFQFLFGSFYLYFYLKEKNKPEYCLTSDKEIMFRDIIQFKDNGKRYHVVKLLDPLGNFKKGKMFVVEETSMNEFLTEEGCE